MNWILEKLIERREFLKRASTFGCIGVLASTSWGNRRSARWSSQVVRIAPAEGQQKAPVVTALALHPDRRLLAIGGDDHLVRVWDLTDQRYVLMLRDHTDWVRTLDYSPDGTVLASAGNDRRLILWDTVSGIKRSEHSIRGHAVTAVCFTHDSAQIASIGFDDSLRFYDVESGVLRRELGCPCVDMRALTLSPDGQRFAGGGRNGKIRIWNARSGQVTAEYAAHQQRIRGLAFSPDGRLLASCGEDRAVHVFANDPGESFVMPQQGHKIMSLVFCGPDQLATGGSDNLIHIWDLNQRAEVDHLQGHTGSIVALAFNGEVLVSGGFDTSVRVWQSQPNVAGEESWPPRRVGRLPFERFGN